MTKPDPYDQLLAGLATSRDYLTLSGKRTFTALRRDGVLHIDPPSLQQRAFPVSRGIYELVRRRYESLPEAEQMRRKNYIKPTWTKTPGAVTGPLVAAIVAAESASAAQRAIREVIAAMPKAPDKSRYDFHEGDRARESQAD